MRSFLPAEPAQFLPGKQVVSDWRRAKIQQVATEALAATCELEAKVDEALRSIEDVAWLPLPPVRG